LRIEKSLKGSILSSSSEHEEEKSKEKKSAIEDDEVDERFDIMLKNLVSCHSFKCILKNWENIDEKIQQFIRRV